MSPDVTEDAAHLENGYTRIANRLLEAILAAGFSPAQLQIMLAIARMTYGWSRKDVTISVPELAHRSSQQYGGWFRESLGQLVAEGVLLAASGGTSKPSTYRIQKAFGAWGRFASTDAELQSNWNRDHNGTANKSRPRRGARKQARPEIGMPEIVPPMCLETGTLEPPNNSTGKTLGGGKEIKKPLRGVSSKKNSGSQPNWVADFGNDWSAIKKGVVSYGKLAGQLKGLFEAPLNLDPAEVRPRWQDFLRSEKSKYGASYFAEHYGDLAGATKPSHEEQLRKRGISTNG